MLHTQPDFQNKVSRTLAFQIYNPHWMSCQEGKLKEQQHSFHVLSISLYPHTNFLPAVFSLPRCVPHWFIWWIFILFDLLWTCFSLDNGFLYFLFLVPLSVSSYISAWGGFSCHYDLRHDHYGFGLVFLESCFSVKSYSYKMQLKWIWIWCGNDLFFLCCYLTEIGSVVALPYIIVGQNSASAEICD